MQGWMLPLCVVVALACGPRGPHAGQAAPREHLVRRGLLAAAESVVGRAAMPGRFALFTSGRRLIEIAFDGAVTERRLDASDVELWGLGAAPDGSLWALAGRDTLVEVSPDRPRRRIPLDGAYAGVHSGPGFLLYQPYDFRVGSPALLRGGPDAVGTPAGQLKVAGGAGRRVTVWMKSLVQCGFVLNRQVPCWPAGTAIVDVIDAGGAGRIVALAGLAPRLDLSAEVFAERGRPVLQDAALDGTGRLWVLATDPGAPAPDGRGVRDLWQFTLSGTRVWHHRLATAVRMLMVAGPDRILAISSEGHLMRLEVR